MRYLLFSCSLFFLMSCFDAKGQMFPTIQNQPISSEYWHDGEIDLEDSETLRGRIKYDISTDNLQYVNGNIIKSFHAEKVLSFQITDAITHKQRNFYSLPFKNENNYVKKHFFELLYEDKVSLLAREKVVERIRNLGNPYSIYGTTTVRYYTVEYDYFLVDEKGEIVFIQKLKAKEVPSYFKYQQHKLREYIEKENLKFDKQDDMILLVKYYNSLVGS